MCKVPHYVGLCTAPFHLLAVSVFDMFRNNEVQPASSVSERGCRLTLKVAAGDKVALNRQVRQLSLRARSLLHDVGVAQTARPAVAGQCRVALTHVATGMVSVEVGVLLHAERTR